MAQSGSFSFQEAFEILLKCKTRGKLKKVIKDHIYPAFDDDFRYFLIQVSETNPPPLIGCSTLSMQDQEVIRSYLEEDPLAKLLLLQNEVSEQVYLRNENEAQTLFAFIAYKIKSIAQEEALVKSRAMVQGLLKSPSGIAVIAVANDSKNVVTSNQAFREIFDMTSRLELPQNLVKILEREQDRLNASNPGKEAEKWGREVSFFTLPKGTYKLHLIPLEVQGLWLLRIHPAADPFTKSNRLIEKAGLTWREMEICCLIHDGLGRNEIAERLFISTHTVKTHLKKIHKKLQVNSRTQLVAYLNQHADEANDDDFV